MKNFLRNEDGSVAVMAALFSTIGLGMLALTLDYANLGLNRQRLQSAADAAALGAALALPDASTAVARGVALVGSNVPAEYGVTASTSDVIVGTYDSASKAFSAGGSAPNAVQVTTHRRAAQGNAVRAFFAQVWGHRSFDITAVSVAVKFGGDAPKACIYTLDRLGGFIATGNVSVNHCGLQSNGSVALTGNVNLASPRGDVCYGLLYTGIGNVNVTQNRPVACPSVADPLASLPEPTAPAWCVKNPVVNNGTLKAGCYSGVITLSNNVTLEPGLFYLKGAIFAIAGNTNITGNGVTLYLDQNSTFDAVGNSNIRISAPTSGDYKGVVFFGARSGLLPTTMTWTGNSNMVVNGTIYLPNTLLVLTGNTNMGSNLEMLIVRNLTVTGNSNINTKLSDPDHTPTGLNKPTKAGIV